MGRWRTTRAWARLGILLLLALAVCLTPHSISAFPQNQDGSAPGLVCDCAYAGDAERPECNCHESTVIKESRVEAESPAEPSTEASAEHYPKLNEDSAGGPLHFHSKRSLRVNEDPAEDPAEDSYVLAKHPTKSHDNSAEGPLHFLNRHFIGLPRWLSSGNRNGGEHLQRHLPFGISKVVGQVMNIPKIMEDKNEDENKKEDKENKKSKRETVMQNPSDLTHEKSDSQWHKIDTNKYDLTVPLTEKPWKKFGEKVH